MASSVTASSVLSADQVLERLQWRYATKKFNPDRKISDEDWQALEQSLVLSPSSFGQQPWKFFVVRNPDVRKQIHAHAWEQSQVIEASHLVVFAIKQGIGNSDVDRYIDCVSSVRDTPKEKLEGLENAIKGFLADHPLATDVNEWSHRQLYIALAFFLYSAAAMGIDACPMEGLMPSEVDQVLGLDKQGYAAKALCAVGYRAEEDKTANMAKVRYETSELVQYID